MVNVKPINKDFGFWLLLLLGLCMSLKDQPTAFCVCVVGALLFNAIKSK